MIGVMSILDYCIQKNKMMIDHIHFKRNVDDLWVLNKTRVLFKKLKMKISGKLKIKKSTSKI